ncbi:potassium transporter TrkG [Thalassoglobus sp. JC818]|uniref:TrkH family potassium uptake protein n=1 Tax=Thalassoglobus sp. JC818 TaxID=3232136 RepID=UPI00345B1FCC
MKSNHPLSQAWNSRPTRHPQRAQFLRRCDSLAQVVGVAAILVGHGLRRSGQTSPEFGAVVIFAMALISFGIAVRFRWSLAQQSFSRRHLPTVAAAGVWGLGMILAIILGPILPDTNGTGLGGGRWWGMVHLSEIVLGLYSIAGMVQGIRRLAGNGVQPTFLLIGSFLVLITVGTVALMLPIARNPIPGTDDSGAPFSVALFTATSASCVTGLIVVDTPTYWSRFGQIVILNLFQVGGLGIMSFGAFFAVIAGRNVRLSEFATMRDLLASGNVGNFRRLVFAVLGTTFGVELLGAILLMPLWDHLPFGERCFMSLFHSVSAFCNAGFALTEDSFVGMSDRWEVSGIICTLIIVGGLGFSILYNLVAVGASKLRRVRKNGINRPTQPPIRLRLDTKLVVGTTFWLLFGGTVMILLLERTGSISDESFSVADAWFQSVTFRTAGFNTVDLGELQTSTKLIAVLLMIIGASPGSTGGGIKTIVFAVAVVGLLTVLRGREKVEAFGRTLSSTTVNRALVIVFVFMLTVMTATILLVIFERKPELFLDHLFEATSAVGTVGVSTTVTGEYGEVTSTTQSLSYPSRFVIVVAMFLGRIGPLTLLLALAGEGKSARYDYPVERVTLG